LKKELMW